MCVAILGRGQLYCTGNGMEVADTVCTCVIPTLPVTPVQLMRPGVG